MYTLFSYMYWYIYLLWVQLFTYGFFSWDVYGAGLEDWAVRPIGLPKSWLEVIEDIDPPLHLAMEMAVHPMS